jgi:hypothetical protein
MAGSLCIQSRKLPRNSTEVCSVFRCDDPGPVGKFPPAFFLCMALNRRKTILFVAKKGTVKNAVRSACNAMMADWQANGRLAAPEGTTVSTPVVPGTSSAGRCRFARYHSSRRLSGETEHGVRKSANDRCSPEAL